MTRVLRSALLPLALGAGLVGLAVLQYRWTDELARAEQDRLRAGMEAAAARFGDDLTRELGRLIAAFRPRGGAFDDAAVRYVRQAEEWAVQAIDARVLGTILLADEGDGGWRLRRLERGGFVPSPWTATLEPVRDRLESAAGLGPGSSPLVSEVPALVIGTRPPPPPGVLPLRQAVVLVLDMAALREHLFPALAARHFAGLDCDLAVLGREDPGHVVWTSRPGFPDEHRAGDVTAPLMMMPRPPERHPPRPWGPPPMPPPGPPFMGAGVGPGPPPPPPDRLPAWQLVVAHRAGSLEAAVARTRWRNLGIGLAALLLLGGSAVLLALSGHRAHALARQHVGFVATVSHELRTPLAAIRSAGQNLADGVVTDPAQVRRYGTLVREEGERLTALVEQTLELSGMLARGQSARLVEVDPAGLVKDVLAEVRPQAQVEVDLPEGLPAVVGDATALRGALRNLVDNALKHGDGQWVAVRARTAPSADGGQELRLVVEDRGPGVTGGDGARWFEPFYRGATARERRVPGSGLGLSVVRHVAEAHGGRVTVAAGPGGRGAAFTLHVPLPPPESRA